MEYPRTRGFDTEGLRKWRKSRVPTQHGGYICFRTLSPASNSVTDFYTIPLYFANNGVGGPVYLKPFYRSGMIPLSSTFVAAGSPSLFCLGGTEEKQHTLKPIKRIYRFDTRDPNRGWHVHDFHMLSRSDCHVTIAMDGKVFVLGGLECSDNSRAEFFDPIWDSSLPLPQQLPSPLPSNSDKFATAALTDSKRILVASCISDEAYVYHVMTGEWEEWDQKVNFFPKNPVRGEAAVLRNTTLCWFQEHDHVLHAYNVDLKMWLECPIRGLDEIFVSYPLLFSCFFILARVIVGGAVDGLVMAVVELLLEAPAVEMLASSVGKQGTWLGVAIKAAEEILATSVGKQGTWLGTALKGAGGNSSF
ncbi:hypothetical protein Vadar_013708 [Vaccinium darrowii]|uniref:Uncharacterized protein n=1 Tax=Vaccinium darrowii TaxID=229202 RepID=A0ACB7YVM2_9ERIC|nr:hypothetical protein Vadar_013708 [Vaccinium darrowii]